MESAGLRRRDDNAVFPLLPAITKARDEDEDFKPPRYTIDLSLPPVERYQHVAKDFLAEVPALPRLFDELVQELHPKISVGTIRRLARLLLRRVNSREETEELRGIHQVTGIKMYLLVAFNVLLDLLMGCTSGGVRVHEKNKVTRMLHFRTLDWGMEPLRRVIVHLDFVEKSGGEVIASTVTYVGYVGLLTGVRKALSISLNFRPNHDASTRFSNFRFYFHHLLVLLGLRPSISSLLRQCLLPNTKFSSNSASRMNSLDSIERSLPGIHTTAAYLIFSDGQRTIAMEKDHHTAIVRSADDFIVATNHDVAEETKSCSHNGAQDDSKKTLQMIGMEDIVEDSIVRKDAATSLWEKSLTKSERDASEHSLTTRRVLKLLDTYPTTNEETHFGAVMDPTNGQFIYIKRYIEPRE